LSSQTELGRQLGTTFQLAGAEIAAFPTPDQLISIPDVHPDLGARKLDRLRGVARSAQNGDLDVGRLRGLGPDGTHADVQHLEGIGPFYASLIVRVRLVGRECDSLAPLTIRGVRGPWSVVLREVVLRRCGRRQEKRGGIPKSALLGSVD
jgi:hypothetical protein